LNQSNSKIEKEIGNRIRLYENRKHPLNRRKRREPHKPRSRPTVLASMEYAPIKKERYFSIFKFMPINPNKVLLAPLALAIAFTLGCGTHAFEETLSLLKDSSSSETVSKGGSSSSVGRNAT